MVMQVQVKKKQLSGSLVFVPAPVQRRDGIVRSSETGVFLTAGERGVVFNC